MPLRRNNLRLSSAFAHHPFVKCVIGGAGMAGLTAGAALQAVGWNVTILDKGRGVGGRMATRRIGDQRLDHGAQFFTVREKAFADAAASWRERGWVEPWFESEGHVRYRAVGGMNQLAKHLARDLAVRTSEKIVRLQAADGKWGIETEAGLRLDADLLILTMPAPQTLDLLSLVDVPDAATASLRSIDFDPCLALLITAEGESKVPFPGYARPAEGPVAWVADNRQKGLTESGVALTIHATASFSREYLERPAEAEAILRREASRWFDGEIRDVQFHRWRYSQPNAPVASRRLVITHPAPLILAGDAFGGPRIEGAFLSGSAAAEEAL
jgi:predicted NAD/FAD-dependent oxidoreductase